MHKRSVICLGKGLFGVALVGLLATPLLAAEVGSVDWSQVPVSKPRLFYPGQSSYEWLRIEDHKKASNEVKGGEACLKCHKGEQKSLGGILVEEGRLEPDPIDGKSGYKRIEVQAAHDAENIYLRVSWESDAEVEGNLGNFIRSEGGEWAFWGNHRQHETVLDEEQPAIYPDRLGIMIGDNSVPLYPEHGCWMTCHDSLVGMPEEADEDEVAEHPVIGKLYEKFGVKNEHVRKFLPGSRDDETSWDTVKAEGDLAALRKKGAFLDLIIWDASLTNPVDYAADFNVLEIKKVDAGDSPLLPNGKMIGGPEYMFDTAKVGYAALTEDDLNDPAKAKHLILGVNTAPYDAGAIEDGGLLPAHVLDPQKASGSAADVQAKGTWEDGTYTVVLSRKLDTGHPDDDIALKVGSIYTFGFSIHDDAAGKRAHQVSFPVTVSIGAGAADIQAVTLK
ncbi:MAG: hypothetical protein DRR03_01930 [Gammaproteobacteria bacterium]|nr:MAG: hypothetical protein DRR03_01930 [Gammaproteobacteria bacterium]